VTRQVAKTGVGKRGRSLEGKTGIARVIAQPARTLFVVEQRLVFEVQIPEAMKLHEAMNGQPPKSHEEFMEKIIKENRIQLPTLPRDQKYVYDPATKQLMVEMPARQ
jgi:hypothetical protein